MSAQAGGPWLYPDVILCDRCGRVLRFEDAKIVPVHRTIPGALDETDHPADYRCCAHCARILLEGGGN